MKDFLLSRTIDTQFDGASLFSFQAAHGFFVCHYLSYKSRIVHFDDAVSSQHAHFLRRSSGDDIVHVDSIVLNGKLDAYTAKASFQVRVDRFQVFGGDISRVGVQFAQNLRHGFFHEVIHIDRIYILVIDDAQEGIQLVR